MIKTFENYQLYSQEDNITLEMVDINDFINEEFNLKFYLKQDKPMPFFPGDLEKFNEFERRIKDYLSEINPFVGIFINKANHTIKHSYTITPSEHYITKIYRKKYEDPDGFLGYTVPDIFEGIDLLYKNKNTITKYLSIDLIQNDHFVLAKSKAPGIFSVLFVPKKKGKNTYDLTLISQMKGKTCVPKVDSTPISIHPLGDK